MTEAEKIGFLANLRRCQAQETLHRGDVNPTDYEAVHDLYMTAYNRPELAAKAKSLAAERYMEAKTNAR